MSKTLIVLIAVMAFTPVHSLAQAPSQLSVSVVSVDSSVVPRGGSRVPVATLSVQNSCGGTVNISDLTVRLTGHIDPAAVEAVFATEGVRRVSRVAHIDNNSRLATLRLPALRIPSCGTRNIIINFSLSRDAEPASQFGVEIPSASSIRTSASDVSLNKDRVNSSVRVSPTTSPTLTLTFLPVTGRLRYGATETVSRLQLRNTGSDKQIIRSITLTNDGFARGTDLRNLFLQTPSGTRVSDIIDFLSDRQVTLTLMPECILERGNVKQLHLKADVRASPQRTVRFIVDEEADIDAGIYRGR